MSRTVFFNRVLSSIHSRISRDGVFHEPALEKGDQLGALQGRDCTNGSRHEPLISQQGALSFFQGGKRYISSALVTLCRTLRTAC